MSDRSDAAALSYLDGLLRMAVAQRGNPPNAVAGRVMLPILGMAMAYGGTQLIAAYLTPEPDVAAVYQVRRLGPGDTETTVVSDDLNAVAALRAAVRFSRDGMGGIQVVGRTEAGVERRSLSRTHDGVLEYLFPTIETYSGPEDAVTVARQRWDAELRRWGHEIDAPEPAAASTTTATAGEDTDPLADRIVARLVDAITPLLASGPRPMTALVSARSPSLDDRAAEQIAAMVAYQINSFLDALSPDGVGPVQALRQIEPLLGGIDVTQKQLLAQAANQVSFEALVANALEHLELQVWELREQTRTAATALQALTDQVSVLSRRTDLAAERLSAAVGQELDQFGDRFKHQLGNLESAAKRSARDMPVPEAVTRLTTRLARTEAQLDQLLKRLHELAPAEPRETPT